jgi:gliding motility-associated-like protein
LKKAFGTVVIGLLCFYGSAQNLVPNGNFEAFTTCPNALTQIYLAAPWYVPTFDSSDFYNGCSPSGISGVPANVNGFQKAHSGSGYAGVSCFSTLSTNHRAYIQVGLTDSLIAQRNYCISVFVNLANTSGFALTELGAFFSTAPLTSLSQAPLAVIPQLSSAAHVYLKDTLNWMLISGNYVAQGGEKYITLGNFKDDANTDTLRLNALSGGSYYYIDDVSVRSCDSVSAVSSIRVPNIFTPNNDKLNDVFQISTMNITYLNCRIYDRWGGKVYELVSDYDSWDGRNNTGQTCADGVYFYILKAIGSDGKSYSKTGFIQLSR